MPGWQCSVALLLLLSGNAAHAANLGVAGAVHEIVEPDFRAVLMERLLEIDTDEFSDTVRKSVDDYEQTKIPAINLPVVVETTRRLFDPSVIATRDVYAMVPDNSGELVRTAIVKKGQVGNPLHHSRPVNALLYFDARDPEQLELAERALTYDPETITPVLTAGTALELVKRWKRPVRRAFDWQISRLKLQHTPALVFAGHREGERDRLVIVEFARPFDIGVLESEWVPTLRAALPD